MSSICVSAKFLRRAGARQTACRNVPILVRYSFIVADADALPGSRHNSLTILRSIVRVAITRQIPF